MIQKMETLFVTIEELIDYWITRPRWLLRSFALISMCMSTPLLAEKGESSLLNSDQSVFSYLELHAEASIFVTALKHSSVWEKLIYSNEKTLFVPTDEALRSEGSAFLLEVVLTKHENEDRLENLMVIHAYAEKLNLDTEDDGQFVILASNGECLNVAAKNGVLKVGSQAQVTKTVIAVDGIIFFVDRLLWTPYKLGKNCK